MYVSEMAQLLNISEEKAEDIAARMIEENRVSGYIDRTDGVIYFTKQGKYIIW